MDLSSDPANVPRASFSECTPYQTVNFARVAGRFSALRYSAIPCDRGESWQSLCGNDSFIVNIVGIVSIAGIVGVLPRSRETILSKSPADRYTGRYG